MNTTDKGSILCLQMYIWSSCFLGEPLHEILYPVGEDRITQPQSGVEGGLEDYQWI